MARSGKRQERGRLRLRETAIKAAVIGGLIVLLPVFLGGSALVPALRSLAPLGWFFLVAGAGGAWWLRQKPESIDPLAARDECPTQQHQVRAEAGSATASGGARGAVYACGRHGRAGHPVKRGGMGSCGFRGHRVATVRGGR